MKVNKDKKVMGIHRLKMIVCPMKGVLSVVFTQDHQEDREPAVNTY